MNFIPIEWEHQIEDGQYLSLLINPQFVEIEGLIIIQAHYNSRTFPVTWTPIIHKYPNEIQRIENTINHIHLSNFTENVSMQEVIGKYIRDIWSKELQIRFPDFQFEMPLFFANDEWELGLWTTNK